MFCSLLIKSSIGDLPLYDALWMTTTATTISNFSFELTVSEKVPHSICLQCILVRAIQFGVHRRRSKPLPQECYSRLCPLREAYLPWNQILTHYCATTRLESHPCVETPGGGSEPNFSMLRLSVGGGGLAPNCPLRLAVPVREN